MDFGARTARVVISALSATTMTLILSASAFAASNAVKPCEQVGRDLKSLDVPVEKLTLNAVDHVPIEVAGSEAISANVEPRISDFEAPILLLTPRVTNILRDVFGASTDVEAAVTTEQKPTSPLADSDAATESNAVPVDAESKDNDLPLYQRQMYRTDI